MTAQILVVDDDIDICANVADILGEMGYRIDVAYRGYDAIELVKRRPYDLFLLDFRLPCMTGTELYQRLKESGGTAPSILVTGFVSPDTVDQAKAAGVSQVVQKPVDFGNLISAIEHTIRKPTA